MYKRTDTKVVDIGGVKIGGGNKIAIQSMTNTKTADVEATVRQILSLEEVGCDIIRVAVLDNDDALAISDIKKRIHIPLVADIHFNGDFALQAVRSGADKIRLNPGNIENEKKIKEILDLCNEKNVPIRIGVNSGSLNKKYAHSEESMIASALEYLDIFHKYNFDNVVFAFKSSDPLETLRAYRLAANTFNYPLHLGVTEAGGLLNSTIKSSVALGSLLLDGIGDTIRISISDDPLEEIKVAKKLLKTCGLKDDVPNLISCPTCGRIQYDMIPIVKEMEAYLEKVNKDVNIAIMGCPVNGVQEASRADFGVAGGKDSAVFFRKGKIVRTIPSEDIIKVLKEEVDKF